MDLDPGIRKFIERSNLLYRDQPASATIMEQRALYNDFALRFREPYPAGLAVEDRLLPTRPAPLRARLYRPDRPGPLAGILYLHGGGWVLGSPDTHDSVTAALALATGALVVSLDYRLAPEHPYPTPFEDSYAALLHLADAAESLGVDAARIAVAGDSAGGNLAAALALAARDRGGPRIAGQALVYPALGTDFSLPSFAENAEAPMLTSAAAALYWQLYLGGRPEEAEPYAAPLLAPSLERLPPAFVSTAQYDPVRDDGERYADRLRQAGVPVELRRARRLVHGWLRALRMSEDARSEFGALAAALRRFLGD